MLLICSTWFKKWCDFSEWWVTQNTWFFYSGFFFLWTIAIRIYQRKKSWAMLIITFHLLRKVILYSKQAAPGKSSVQHSTSKGKNIRSAVLNIHLVFPNVRSPLSSTLLFEIYISKRSSYFGSERFCIQEANIVKRKALGSTRKSPRHQAKH